LVTLKLVVAAFEMFTTLIVECTRRQPLLFLLRFQPKFQFLAAFFSFFLQNAGGISHGESPVVEGINFP